MVLEVSIKSPCVYDNALIETEAVSSPGIRSRLGERYLRLLCFTKKEINKREFLFAVTITSCYCPLAYRIFYIDSNSIRLCIETLTKTTDIEKVRYR